MSNLWLTLSDDLTNQCIHKSKLRFYFPIKSFPGYVIFQKLNLNLLGINEKPILEPPLRLKVIKPIIAKIKIIIEERKISFTLEPKTGKDTKSMIFASMEMNKEITYQGRMYKKTEIIEYKDIENYDITVAYTEMYKISLRRIKKYFIQ